MATREENLKKINDELEKLDDEQLEKIAGGTGRALFEATNAEVLDDNSDLTRPVPRPQPKPRR